MMSYDTNQYTYVVNNDGYHIPFSPDFKYVGVVYIAEDAAKDYYYEHDGWDYNWPVRISIYKDGDFLGKFKVELDNEPIFMPLKEEV